MVPSKQSIPKATANERQISKEQVAKVLSGVYVFKRPLPSFGIDVSSTLLLGRSGAVVFDTMCSPHDMRPVLEILCSAGFEGGGFEEHNRRYRLWIVYSHADWDHCLGTAAFGGFLKTRNAVVIAQKNAMNRTGSLTRCDLQKLKSNKPSLVKNASVISPEVAFDARISIDLDWKHVDLDTRETLAHRASGQKNSCFVSGEIVLVHVPGHTSDSVVCYVPSRDLLIAGDVVEDPFPSIGAPEHMHVWINFLETWANKVKTVIPSHGKPQGPELLWQNARYLRRLWEEAREGRRDSRASLELDQLLYGFCPEAQKFYKQTHQANAARLRSRVGNDL